jgi:hypothetical protein
MAVDVSDSIDVVLSIDIVDMAMAKTEVAGDDAGDYYDWEAHESEDEDDGWHSARSVGAMQTCSLEGNCR